MPSSDDQVSGTCPHLIIISVFLFPLLRLLRWFVLVNPGDGVGLSLLLLERLIELLMPATVAKVRIEIGQNQMCQMDRFPASLVAEAP